VLSGQRLRGGGHGVQGGLHGVRRRERRVLRRDAVQRRHALLRWHLPLGGDRFHAGALGPATGLLLFAGVAWADAPTGGAPAGPAPPFRFRHLAISLTGEAADERIGGQRLGAGAGGTDATFIAQTTWPSRWGTVGDASLRALGGSTGSGLALLLSAELDLAGQYVAPLALAHGPLLALGFRFETFWNFPPGWIWLEAPRLEAGYEYAHGDLLVRATAYSSFLVGSGSIDTYGNGNVAGPDYGAKLFVSAWGSYVSLYAHHVVDAGDNPGIPVDQATGSACFFVLHGVQACARASLFRAPTPFYAPAVAEWRVWSLDIGLGTSSQAR
jgi:hypothetical protein